MSGAYLITFVCYGSHLPREEGVVDRQHNHVGAPTLPSDARRLANVQGSMANEPYRMDASRRGAVLQSIQDLCLRRRWQLIAAHVRSAHVHIVIEADQSPEQVMTAMKAFASAELNKLGIDRPNRRRWARHGSTRYLWTPQQLSTAIHYVACNQGEPMALYVANR